MDPSNIRRVHVKTYIPLFGAMNTLELGWYPFPTLSNTWSKMSKYCLATVGSLLDIDAYNAIGDEEAILLVLPD